ncbi:nucleoside hydrolase [Flavihumibacter petaseus]|uniref:Putative hydrolase n=1 Tax=Flavihumibacter petaseus NBRC 106054 TaxID=1220578 RepID=A0A0E9MYC6_9BACT|nr:nucleoside hydrolase [Flavihumibacter petaseus]GAO42737.1 putative hydrolase [Flavihumibacter petaseus NBRC 106054]
MLRLAVLTILCWLTTACRAIRTPQGEVPLPVIFDTDVGNDIDDVLALQMLFNYEQQQKIRLLGITISKAYPRVVDYIDGYARLNKRGNIPIGYAYNGPNPEPGRYVNVTLDTLINGRHILLPQRSLGQSIPEGFKLMRKLLARQSDGSVVLIAVGPETNLGRLLESPPDEFSKLNGVDLVRKKVKLVSLMGGRYTHEYDFAEWNILQDLPAARTVFEKCPVPVISSGVEVGYKILYPASSIEHDFPGNGAHPLVVSYKVYEKFPYDRPSWDLTAVLQAIEPGNMLFALSPAGNISVDTTGNTNYSPEADGRHRYLTISAKPNAIVDTLVYRTTGISR